LFRRWLVFVGGFDFLDMHRFPFVFSGHSATPSCALRFQSTAMAMAMAMATEFSCKNHRFWSMPGHPSQGGTACAAIGVSLGHWFRYRYWFRFRCPLPEKIIKRLLDCGCGGFVGFFGHRRRSRSCQNSGWNHYRGSPPRFRLQHVPPCDFAVPVPVDVDVPVVVPVHIVVAIVVPLALSSPARCLFLLPQQARKRTKPRRLPQRKERIVVGRKPSVSY